MGHSCHARAERRTQHVSGALNLAEAHAAKALRSPRPQTHPMVFAQMPVVRSEADVSILLRAATCQHRQLGLYERCGVTARASLARAPVALRHGHTARGGRHDCDAPVSVPQRPRDGCGACLHATSEPHARESSRHACAPEAARGTRAIASNYWQAALSQAQVKARGECCREGRMALCAPSGEEPPLHASNGLARRQPHSATRPAQAQRSTQQPAGGAGARQLVLLRRGANLASCGDALSGGAVLGVAHAAHDLMRRVEHAARRLLRARTHRRQSLSCACGAAKRDAKAGPRTLQAAHVLVLACCCSAHCSQK